MIIMDKLILYPFYFRGGGGGIRESSNCILLIIQLNGIAKAHLLRGEYEKMADLCRKCLPITQHVGDKVNTISTFIAQAPK